MPTRANAERFCTSFGVRVPVLNAPMAGIAGGRLAAAVAGAGGLGLVGGGYGDIEWIERELAVAGRDDVGLGLITWSVQDRPEVVTQLLSFGVRTWFFSFGESAQLFGEVVDRGGRVIAQVQSADEAVAVVRAGALAVVAQGEEAGGHGRAGTSVEALVRATVAAIDVPVLAAGGVSTVDDVRRARSWGAAGVVVGTRLYATHEALDVGAAKQLLIDAAPGSTVRTGVFDAVRGPQWPDGFDGRSLRNDLTDQWSARPDGVLEALEMVRADYAAAAVAQDFRQRVVWAGAGVGSIRSLGDAASVVKELSAAFDDITTCTYE